MADTLIIKRLKEKLEKWHPYFSGGGFEDKYYALIAKSTLEGTITSKTAAVMINLFDGETLEAIADKFDVKKQAIHQRKAYSMRKIRDTILDRGREDYGELYLTELRKKIDSGDISNSEVYLYNHLMAERAENQEHEKELGKKISVLEKRIELLRQGKSSDVVFLYISELGIPSRFIYALTERGKISGAVELGEKRRYEVENIRGCGKVGMQHLDIAMSKVGIAFKEEELASFPEKSDFYSQPTHLILDGWIANSLAKRGIISIEDLINNWEQSREIASAISKSYCLEIDRAAKFYELPVPL